MIELKWMGPSQRKFLERGYLYKGQTPEERYQEICDAIQLWCDKMGRTQYTQDIGKRFEMYISRGWVSFSSPQLANFGKKDNLAISCNMSILSDSLDDIYKGIHELGMLAKYGAGTSQNFSKLRPIGSDIQTGGTSNSVMDWVELYADMMSKTSQNRQRRGFLTAYLSVDHPEINEFLDIGTHRLPKDKRRFFETITTGVTLPRGWRKEMMEGDAKKREIWAKILKTKKEAGFPYIIDLENANNAKPQVYKDKEMDIETSNICCEIIEYCDETKTFACCVSSVNAYHFDEWKNHDYFIMDMNIMMDCVIQEYIEKGKHLPGMEKAVRFAEEHRAIGLGVLGFHSYLQKNMVAMGSLKSFAINHELFSYIREKSDEASRWMAENWGEPKILKGYGLRNTTRIAQAPTKSTSFIMGGDELNLSEGIEPLNSNYNTKKRAHIQVEAKNPHLKALLKEKGKDNSEVWNSILDYNGSVQHLDFLTQDEKDVFKTAFEISQVDLIKLAAQRQKFIDQGQSLNLFIHSGMSPKEVSKLHLLAFDEGIKSLYYQYGVNAAQQFIQTMNTCSSCEA